MKFASVLRLSAAAVVAAASIAGTATQARAQNFDNMSQNLTDTLQTAVDLLPEGVTNVRLGLGPVIAPDYEGSDDYNVDPVPVVSLRYKNLVEIDNNEIKLIAFRRLLSTNTSMGGGNFRAGPLISINFGRDEDNSPDLFGMGNVGTALELGAFVSYTFPGGSRVRLRARHDVISGHGGAIATADYLVPLLRTNRVTLGAIVAGTWASGAYMRSYFGVNAAQSAASGYPIFNATSGFKDVNTGLNAIYMIAQQWSVVGNVSYKRLIGQAADSPIVRIAGSPNQMNYAAYLVYSF